MITAVQVFFGTQSKKKVQNICGAVTQTWNNLQDIRYQQQHLWDMEHNNTVHTAK